MRGYIATHRNDASYSAQYAALEDVYLKIAENKNGQETGSVIYRMDSLEKNLLENFLTARNNALLFGKSNIGPDGKPTIVNPEDNRPIIMTDGIIAQCEAFCSKVAYNKLSVPIIQTVMGMLNEKADDAVGNH